MGTSTVRRQGSNPQPFFHLCTCGRLGVSSRNEQECVFQVVGRRPPEGGSSSPPPPDCVSLNMGLLTPLIGSNLQRLHYADAGNDQTRLASIKPFNPR